MDDKNLEASQDWRFGEIFFCKSKASHQPLKHVWPTSEKPGRAHNKNAPQPLLKGNQAEEKL